MEWSVNVIVAEVTYCQSVPGGEGDAQHVKSGQQMLCAVPKKEERDSVSVLKVENKKERSRRGGSL